MWITHLNLILNLLIEFFVYLISVRPTSVRIETAKKPLSADKPVEIQCSAWGSRPSATITWWKGSSKMKKTRDKISLDGNSTTSTLTFTPVSDDNGKYLSCRAENNLIHSSAIEDGWTLEVYCEYQFCFDYFHFTHFHFINLYYIPNGIQFKLDSIKLITLY